MSKQTTTTTEYLDPATLLVDVNVREDLNLSKQFVGSIKDLGVLVPVVAVRDSDGIRVRFGHRRVHAAIEAGLSMVPVMLVDPDSDDPESEAAQIDRLVGQHAENTHRAGLSTADEIGVAKQLSAFGLTPNQIARRTRTKRAQAEQAVTASGSELATKAADRYDLTLDQAAVLADFEDDKDTVTALVAAAKNGQFEHVAQRARDDRARQVAHDQAVQALTEAGVPVVEAPSYDDHKVLAVDRLKHDGTRLDAESHARCPGHAAYVLVRRNWDSGEYDAEPVEVCTDYPGHGHTDRWAATGATERKPAAQMSEDERAQAKAARRLVIDNNKAWQAATEVRRGWLKTWLPRKTAPKGTGPFLATALTADLDVLTRMSPGVALTNEWFTTGKQTLAGTIAKATEQRAQVIALGRILAAYEDSLTKDTWRRDGSNAAHGRYLRFLAEQGYTLSEVEVYAASDQTA